MRNQIIILLNIQGDLTYKIYKLLRNLAFNYRTIFPCRLFKLPILKRKIRKICFFIPAVNRKTFTHIML